MNRGYTPVLIDFRLSMPLLLLKHRSWWCRAAPAVALCVAVFLWGTGYKLEQFPLRGHACRVMPSAKLLTEKERPPKSERFSTTASSLRLDATSLLMVFVCMGANLCSIRSRVFTTPFNAAGSRRTRREDPAQFHFSFRPPPTFFPIQLEPTLA